MSINYIWLEKVELVYVESDNVLCELLSCPLLHDALQEIRSDQFSPLLVVHVCRARLIRGIPIDPQVHSLYRTIVECTLCVQPLQELHRGNITKRCLRVCVYWVLHVCVLGVVLDIHSNSHHFVLQW